MPRKTVRSFYIYILASKRRTLYTGITSELQVRLKEHREGLTPGFASKYNCRALVFFEEHAYVQNAIAREKQIKNWSRKKRIALIEMENPEWKDLSADWVGW